MHIAVFTDNFYPELSGISDSALALARQLAARGHRLAIYAPRYARRHFRRLGLPAAEIDLGESIAVVRLASLPYPTGTRQGRAVLPTGVPPHLRRFRPDLVHVHLPFGAGLAGLRSARALGVPLVGTNHTPLAEFLRYSPIRGPWSGRLAARYAAWFYGHCDFVSSPSRAILEEMERFALRAPHRVISNPIRTDIFRPLAARERLRAQFDFSGFTLLYAGRLAPEKQLDLAIRAVASLASTTPAVSLALLGRGSAEDDLRALCRSLGVEGRVRFLGFVPARSTVAEIYNAADAFVIPSTAETQCMAAMQAMACGLPVVGVRAWGLAEYINAANGILVDPGDVSALARALAHLATHPQVCRDLGEGGRAFVRAFSAPVIAAEWDDEYREVLRRSRCRRDLPWPTAARRPGTVDRQAGETVAPAPLTGVRSHEAELRHPGLQ
jgi:1,2-diacylglycerol 3-alpha-glucosyltransferase